MTREALDGDDLDARSGDGHNRAAGKEGTPNPKSNPHQSRQPPPKQSRPPSDNRPRTTALRKRCW
ncbi:hypothetical protein GCM10028793_60940 [Nocardiopsis oceani]